MKTRALNSKEINVSMRVDGSFHLSDGVMLEREILKHPHKPLVDFCSNIFTSGRSKRVYTKKEHGYPYLSNSDVIAQNPFDSCNYNSRKYGYDKSAFLKEGMILTGRVGAIGQIAYVTSEFDEKEAMGSDNIIRIIANPYEYSGYIYSFLSSRVGNTLLWKLAAGGVQPYITDQMVKNIPVPIFPESKQQEIHNLIVESANLRVEANLLLEEAINEIEKELPLITEHKYEKVSLSLMIENGLRMEATTNHIQIKRFYEELNERYEIKTIADMSKNVFTPNIFKRQRTNDVSTGVPFLSGSDLTNFRPQFTSFLSKKMKNIDDYILQNGWIAVQDAGTIGYVTLINGYLDGVSATNNLVRIIPNEGNDNLYIFAFLKTKQGQFILKSQQFGSVQKHIDNNTISNFKIPILSSYKRVKSKILDYNLKTTESCIKESQAISLVEKEIESWQQS